MKTEESLQIAHTHYEAGRLGVARTICRQILEFESGRADVLHLLGLIEFAAGSHGEALILLRKAIHSAPGQATYRSNLGVMCRRLGMFEEAIKHLQGASALRPDFAYIHLNLGDALQGAGRIQEAIKCYRTALRIEPNYAEALSNLGNALVEEGQAEEAIGCFQQALSISPNNASFHNNLAYALIESGRWAEVVARSQHALSIQPEFPQAHFNLALGLFGVGRYREGWSEYEWRLRCPVSAEQIQHYSLPRWDGNPVPGRTILVHTEQGFGDTIQFLRFLPLVWQHGSPGRVVLVCPPELQRLIGDADELGTEVVARTCQNSPDLEGIDFQVPLLSVPFTLGLAEPPLMTSPYLRANDAMRSRWRERLADYTGLRVGLNWSGKSGSKGARDRTVKFECLLPMMSLRDVTVFSLNVDIEANSLPGLTDLTKDIIDFADTAALMSELDLIISVDSATAHLAGALCCPLWTMLPLIADWRWCSPTGRSIWYPSARQFRQPSRGDWESVVRLLSCELLKLAGKKKR